MKKQVVQIIILILIMITFGFLGKTYAADKMGIGDLVPYTEEYQKWLQLSEEERSQLLEPRKFEIIQRKDHKTYLNEMNNVFKMQRLLRANISENYDLREKIAENVKIKNQENTNSCWAFATIGVLESNLALRDLNNQKPVEIYDFSEQHMNYATAKRAFLNDEINEYGFNRTLSAGGTYETATQYLSNGLGAVNESEMPFKNSEENIDIAQIQNKEVVTTLYDTVLFPSVDPSQREQIMDSMKEHIVNYGGIYAGIHGAQLLAGGDAYNNKTGAIYCKDEPMDHAVVIIGWDDNYDVSNFNENQRPSQNGAWIIKNSWGEKSIANLSDLKQTIFDTVDNSQWNSPEDITDQEILQAYQSQYGDDKVSIEEENIVIEIGDKGYMYISYEDANVYKNLMGIEKATNTKDYQNVYQNDILGSNALLPINTSGYVYIANVFTRNPAQKEALDRISVHTYQGYKCKVFVNPNGKSMAKEDLQEVKLAEGDSISFEPGYHSIEFANPIELTGDSFAVVLQIEDEGEIRYVSMETNMPGTVYDEAIVNAGESFYTNEVGFAQNNWLDMGITENVKGNVCIKAYTTSEIPEKPDDSEDLETETPENPQKEPIPSDFTNAKSVITESKLYFSSDDLSQASSENIIKISGIKIGDESDIYTYYYHISGKQGENNITDWTEVKATRENDGTYSILCHIKSEELENFEQIVESDNLYVYIKEVAEVNQQKAEQIVTLEVDNQTEPKCYIDGVMIGGIEDILNYNNQNNSNYENQENINQNKDNTVATSVLPHAGGMTFKIIFVVLLIACGGFAYYRYKNIDR